MILYKNTVSAFQADVDDNIITGRIADQFRLKMGFVPGEAEQRSWQNSLFHVAPILRSAKIPDDAGVLIEYRIPSTSKRIDFIVAGHDQNGGSNFVVMELKQWETARATPKESVVESFVGGAVRELAHPSYQAWSYAQFLRDMNDAVANGNLGCTSCAYLHNYPAAKPIEPLRGLQYEEIVRRSPIFFMDETEQLRAFLQRLVGRGEGMGILLRIEEGRLKPSRKLIDFVAGLFQNNQVFTLLDDQKVAFESILSLVSTANPTHKQTIIVEGGPGTGKSVVALNVLRQVLSRGQGTVFVTPNAAFRSVLERQLAGVRTLDNLRLNSIFKGSGQFYGAPSNSLDLIVVDEAHRLKNGSAYMYQGQNQAEDIIKASVNNVFFIDDGQQVRPSDIGSRMEIERLSRIYHSEVHHYVLEAQFRCAGTEGFIKWMEHLLQIEGAVGNANATWWDRDAFDFKLFENPNELYQAIKAKEAAGVNARVIAGYAWPWTSERQGNGDAQIPDVRIAEWGFEMPWNSRKTGDPWALRPSGLLEVGCIHTSQGLEFDYVGVLIGNDLRYDSRSGKLVVSVDDYYDSEGKKGLKEAPERVLVYIKNIYRILISRGMKGCYVYCRDPALHSYLSQSLQRIGPYSDK